MCQSINYTDASLRIFFDKLKKQSWYQNTLFVFCADHSASGVLKEFKNSLGRFALTIAIHDPSNPDFKKLDKETVVQQADILPTALQMLGYNGDFIAFGNDVFDTSKERFAYNCNNGVFQLINDSLLLQFDETSTLGLYRYKTDVHLHQNLKAQMPKEQAQMERKIKAIIQHYNNRMLDNQLVIK